MSEKKGTPATGIPSKSQANHNAKLLKQELLKRINSAKLEKQLLKKDRMLLWLVIASELGIKVTRFDALKVNDTIWNTTVSELSAINHLIIDRQPTQRHTSQWGLTSCHLYWLQGDALKAAQTRCESLLAAKSGEAA